MGIYKCVAFGACCRLSDAFCRARVKWDASADARILPHLLLYRSIEIYEMIVLQFSNNEHFKNWYEYEGARSKHP